ncbi:hypothetical protein Tco_0632362 [Tanacetum coccineum]
MPIGSTPFKMVNGVERNNQLTELEELRLYAYETSKTYKERTKKWNDNRLKEKKEFQIESNPKLSLYIYPADFMLGVVVFVFDYRLYLMRRSLKVLRKFHWTILGYDSTIITEYLVNISKRHAFLSLNEDILKINDSGNQYAVSIKEDTAYPCLHSPKTTKETSSIRLNGKNAYELKGKFLDDLHNNTFSGTNEKDVVEHIEYYLNIIDPIKLPNVYHDKLRIVVFPISLAGDYWKMGGDEIKVSDDESSDFKEYWSDKEEKTAEILKIETDIFDYETPLRLAFNEFNYLLKVDPDLLIKDIMGFKTYEDYKDD